MKAIIFARVSTEEQKEAGNSLPAQIERLERYCERQCLEIVKRFSFDESAYKAKRDEFDKTLDYIKESKEKMAVCFDKVDRLSRNVFDKRVAELHDKALADEIELHFVSDGQIINSSISATEKFQFGISLGLAKYYSDAISDSVKRANENLIVQGRWTSKAPLGYLNTEDDKGNKDVEPDQNKSHYIIRMFERYATGNCSLKTIQAEMEKTGLRSYRDKFVTTSIIDHTLNNPFYYGMMRIKGKLYPHKHAPLISKELFDKVQQVKAGHNKKPFNYASKPFVLRGLITCSDCGCTVSPEAHKGHTYYSCTNFKRKHEKKAYVREEELLQPIHGLLKNIQLSDKSIQDITTALRKTNEAKIEYNRKTVGNLKQEHEKLQNRIDKMFDERLDGGITADMYDRKLKEYKERQAEIRTEIGMHDWADESYYLTVNKVFSLAQRAYEIFESSEVQEKRQLLSFLLQNCQLRNRTLTFGLKKPFDLIAFSAQKLASDKRKSRAFNPAHPIWLRGWDSNPRPED